MNKASQWLLPKNDFVFKLLFGSDNSHSKELLIHFLNDLLQVPEGQSFSNVRLLNPHLHKQHLTDKASILDIRAQIPGAGIVNIEIQLENQYNMDKRTLFYCAKMITEQLHEGDDYKKLRKTTTINLLDFNYFSHNHYHNLYHLAEKRTKKPYPDILELHFIEIKKFKKLQQEGKIKSTDRLAKWIEFISNEDDNKWEIIANKNPMIKKAVNQLKIISQDPENRWEYEIRQKVLKDITSMKNGAREEGRNEGRAEGRAEGKEEGKREGKREGLAEGKVIKGKEIAMKMLQKGVDIDSIAEFTGLSKEEVFELAKNLERD